MINILFFLLFILKIWKYKNKDNIEYIMMKIRNNIL